MLTLYIGNKNYSSWSLRPWLVLKHFNIPFTEELLPLNTPEGIAARLELSPTGKVPVLRDETLLVPESLAICEYLAEHFPDLPLWPDQPNARAHARAISAEMHSGFAALRTSMPMNVKARLPGAGLTEDVQKDINRIISIWVECRLKYNQDGPWLFGNFSIADAMYAPVVSRFLTYGVELPEIGRSYMKTVLSHPAMQAWMDMAAVEQWFIQSAEPYANCSFNQDER
ncbi:glutathione S-transferase family protein [Leeia oryzae]|uniref:glutathione S-transferase family protein n=1 Tax=Leeia oryzae TaxID=356662 RepID=UPI00036336FF|nr:glutathione S-transferase family protein [Leeia oryzae]